MARSVRPLYGTRTVISTRNSSASAVSMAAFPAPPLASSVPSISKRQTFILPRRHAAVNAQGLPGDEGGFLAGEIPHGVGDILGEAPAAGGDQLEIVVLVLLRHFFVALDGDPAW